MVQQQVKQQEQTQQNTRQQHEEQASSSTRGISRGSKRPAIAEGEDIEPPPTQPIQQKQKQRRTVSFEEQAPAQTSAQEQSPSDAPDHGNNDMDTSIDNI